MKKDEITAKRDLITAKRAFRERKDKAMADVMANVPKTKGPWHHANLPSMPPAIKDFDPYLLQPYPTQEGRLANPSVFELRDARGDGDIIKGNMLTWDFEPAGTISEERLHISLSTGYVITFHGAALREIVDKIGSAEVMERLKGRIDSKGKVQE